MTRLNLFILPTCLMLLTPVYAQSKTLECEFILEETENSNLVKKQALIPFSVQPTKNRADVHYMALHKKIGYSVGGNEAKVTIIALPYDTEYQGVVNFSLPVSSTQSVEWSSTVSFTNLNNSKSLAFEMKNKEKINNILREIQITGICDEK